MRCRPDLAARWSPLRAVLVVGFAAFAVIGFIGVTTVSRAGAIDSGEHLLYAKFLDEHGRLPSEAQNYEYSSPPLYQATAVAAERAVHTLPSVALELGSNLVIRAVWLGLVAVGAFLLTRRRRLRFAGLAALLLAALVALDQAISLGKSEPWSAGKLIAFACGLGLVLVTGLIAREVWPGNTRRAVGAGAFAAAYPVVYRMSILFHPEVPFALLCALAVLVLLRAANRSWLPRLGWWLGLLCGLAALTRQPAVLVIGVLGISALAIGRRRAAPFLIRAAAVTLLLAAPWWGYAYHRWRNPLQSNLEPRASLMMSGEPAAFLFSFPAHSLVFHPYSPAFTNALLPKLHADLWSDWYGAIHNWYEPTHEAKRTASSQSVLGLVADALALGGLAALALPALVRVLRRRDRAPTENGLAVLALLAVTAFAGYLVMVLRFPQHLNEPIKSSYLLFTTPCWAIFSVAAWSALVRGRRWLNAGLMLVALLYVLSYGADLDDALAQPSGFPSVGATGGFVDLTVTFEQTSPLEPRGTEVDLLTTVANHGDEVAGNLTLRLVLSPGMHLLGYPAYERGKGCTGLTRVVVCDLDHLNPSTGTDIRYAVVDDSPGVQTVTAVATSWTRDTHPADNRVTYPIAPASP